MKKYLLMTAMAFVLVAPAAAWSQGVGGTPPTGVLAPKGQATQVQGQPQQGQPSQRFEERKAEILGHIAQRLSELQQRQGCVQSAQNHEALRACMPERGEGHSHEEGGHGGEHGQPGK